jgi:CRISPR-associated protein Cmr4
MNARLTLVHALAPLHAGTGQGVGAIDLPIAREKATGLPFLPGSSLKGALRDVGGLDEGTHTLLFGPRTENADKHAGSVQLSDQRLLLMPIRSLAGTFAWVTSPYVLRRFARDVRDTGVAEGPPALVDVPAPAQGQPESCAVAEGGTALAVPGAGLVVLEDLDLAPSPSAAVAAWAEWLGPRLFPDGEEDAAPWRAALAARLCVVRDDLFSFLLLTATEVFARVRLKDEEKTVEQGGLWYEEALPAEAVLAGLAVASPAANPAGARLSVTQAFDALAALTARPVQLGGKATVGRGLCRVRLAQ